MSKIEGDQLRMMVWSASSTCERPLRSSSSLPSMPEERMPIRVETTKMPASVTTSMTMRKPQPASPPMVPASSVRISDCPHRLEEPQPFAAFRRDAGDRQHEGGDGDQRHRDHGQPADQRDRPGGHGLVELVAKPGDDRLQPLAAVIGHQSRAAPPRPPNSSLFLHIQGFAGLGRRAGGPDRYGPRLSTMSSGRYSKCMVS